MLEPRSLPYMLLGFVAQHKGYWCLVPVLGKIYVSTHVRFNEIDFPFLSKPIPRPSTSYPPHAIPNLALILVGASHRLVYNSFQNSNNYDTIQTSDSLILITPLMTDTLSKSHTTAPNTSFERSITPAIANDKSPLACTKLVNLSENTYVFK